MPSSMNPGVPSTSQRLGEFVRVAGRAGVRDLATKVGRAGVRDLAAQVGRRGVTSLPTLPRLGDLPKLPRLPFGAEEALDPTAGRGKVALVTGASSGIGSATALELAKLGFTVYGAARRVERMQTLANLGISALRMDLTDDESMAGGVRQVLEEAGRLDVLVNNAGYGSYGAVETVPMDEARRQFEVNLFGLARLVQLVTPTMREQGAGRIINVSSIGGKIYEPLGAWYHATKYAVEGLSDSLRIELSPFGIEVVIIEPGPIDTEWTPTARRSLIQRSKGTPYETRARRLAALLKRTEGRRFSSPPELVAGRIALAATTASPRTRYPVGVGAGTVTRARKVLPDRALDALVNQL